MWSPARPVREKVYFSACVRVSHVYTTKQRPYDYLQVFVRTQPKKEAVRRQQLLVVTRKGLHRQLGSKDPGFTPRLYAVARSFAAAQSLKTPQDPRCR
jgi:hypothetical protein